MDLEELDKIQLEQRGVTKGELEPFHIGIKMKEILEQAHTMGIEAGGDFLVKAVEEINEKTPDWYWCVAEVGDKELSYYDSFDHEKMGDELIKKYHLVRFPKLLEGAVYDSSRGYWRYFGKNEMKTFAEKETLETLQAWGFYNQKYIPSTRTYVWQKTYNKNYPDSTPFETSKPELVVFKNGTYNILNDTMRPNDPNDYILNAYNYDLDMSKRATPKTIALFRGLVGENALFLMQYIGYIFYRSHAPAQEMLFLKGKGGEGKSTFIGYIMNHILGNDNYSVVTPQDLSNDRFQVVELLGKSANISADIKDDYIEDSSIIKRLTGNDRVYAQFKVIQGFQILSYAKMIFSANKLPKFRDQSEGFSDRLAVVPFINGNQRIEGATFWQQHDMDKVEEESAAFVYACIQEFRKIFDGKKAQFTKSESMEREKSKWLLDNDHIAEFVIESTEIDLSDPRGEIATTVQKEYTQFCRDNGYRVKNPQAMRDYLESIGVPKIKSRQGFSDGGSSQWRYQGLRLTISYITQFDFNSE